MEKKGSLGRGDGCRAMLGSWADKGCHKLLAGEPWFAGVFLKDGVLLAVAQAWSRKFFG